MSDLISRQAALDILDDFQSNIELGIDDYAEKRKALCDLPSAEPKTGKWIVYKAPDKYHCGLVKCPFCEEEMIAEADEYNYCPNCGADMRGGDNEAD